MIRPAIIAIFAICVTMWAVGCFNVNVDASGWSEELDKTIASSQARGIARNAVVKEGLDEDSLEKYEVKAVRQDVGWWVTFDAIRSVAGWPANFAVKVDDSGNAIIFRGSQ